MQPTHCTDQYALAVLVYYALTGIRPFEGQQDPNRRRRNFERGPVPAHEEAARQGNPGVSESLSPVLARALAVKPENRHSSVQEFYQSFAAALKKVKKEIRRPEVFLSYRRDVASGWAALFARELQHHGIGVFIDMQRRDKVVRFPSWLERAIENCDVFVCLLSGNTLDSKWVCEEIRLASKYGKPMVPVMHEDFTVPDSFSDLETHIETLLMYQGVTLLDRKGEYIDAAISHLAEMIQQSAASSQGNENGTDRGRP